MMYLAFWIADRVQSTLGPSVQKPCSSGALTCKFTADHEMSKAYQNNICVSGNPTDPWQKPPTQKSLWDFWANVGENRVIFNVFLTY